MVIPLVQYRGDDIHCHFHLSCFKFIYFVNAYVIESTRTQTDEMTSLHFSFTGLSSKSEIKLEPPKVHHVSHIYPIKGFASNS
jgi:hypothetical protein